MRFRYRHRMCSQQILTFKPETHGTRVTTMVTTAIIVMAVKPVRVQYMAQDNGAGMRVHRLSGLDGWLVPILVMEFKLVIGATYESGDNTCRL